MRSRISRALLLLAAPIAMIVASVTGAVGASVAQAYGTEHVYQLTFSLNCDDRNSPLCAPTAFGLGGVWGWIEPGSDNTADATVTFCTHGQGPSGAFHQNLDGVAWSIVPSAQLDGRFPVGTDPNGNYIVFDAASPLGFIAFPATANKYAMSFGPGITAQSTVTLMH
jgi:hypothetical protein